MADIATTDLLAAIHDALTIPQPATPEARLGYLELARDRAAAVRRAVDHARKSGDLEHATDLIDGAMADLRVTYPTEPLDVGVLR